MPKDVNSATVHSTFLNLTKLVKADFSINEISNFECDFCNYQFHRPDYGDTLAASIAQHGARRTLIFLTKPTLYEPALSR